MKEKRQVKSLKSQSAWLLIAKIIGFSFSFMLPLIVVRVLSLEQVGLYRQAFIVVSNASAILPLGFGMSAFYYLSRDEERRASAIFNIVLFNFAAGFLAFLVLFFYPQILGKIFDSSDMTRLAPIIGLAVWLWLFSMFLEVTAVANQESRLATLFIVFAQFSKTALMVAAVLWFGTVESILYAAIIQGGLQTLILLLYLNYRFPKFWLAFNLKFFREHLVYALPFGIAGIFWTAQNDIHYYFVSNAFGEAMFAIYAIGCFQLPLITMLAESVSSVLIPRMSELQLLNDRKEMIRITVGAMQKLSFFYFPAYVFLFITAETFITTLFTDKFIESVPVFVIFLTFLPFHIMLADPIVRAYKDLGKFLLKLRIFTFVILFTALYFGIQYFALKGVIATVVIIRVAEMLTAESVVFYRIGVRPKDFRLLKDIGKTALVSLFAGIFTYAVYFYIRELTPDFGKYLVGVFFAGAKPGITNFVSGTITLGISFIVYSTIYLLTAYFWNIIDDGEKQFISETFNKMRKPFMQKAIQNPQSEI